VYFLKKLIAPHHRKRTEKIPIVNPNESKRWKKKSGEKIIEKKVKKKNTNKPGWWNWKKNKSMDSMMKSKTN
jgi:hypothetical protein